MRIIHNIILLILAALIVFGAIFLLNKEDTSSDKEDLPLEEIVIDSPTEDLSDIPDLTSDDSVFQEVESTLDTLE